MTTNDEAIYYGGYGNGFAVGYAVGIAALLSRCENLIEDEALLQVLRQHAEELRLEIAEDLRVEVTSDDVPGILGAIGNSRE